MSAAVYRLARRAVPWVSPSYCSACHDRHRRGGTWCNCLCHRRGRRVMTAIAHRFLLRTAPACADGYALAAADGRRHALLRTLAASFAPLAAAVLAVGVREGGGEESS
jgi:hypothetical protein